MSWKSYQLGDILKRKRTSEKIIPEKEYKLVTIRLYHKGVCLRSKVRGEEIKSAMSSVKEGDFILSGIDARNGAFGIVPAELDGAVVTNDFWCLEPDEKIIDKEFLLFLTSTEFFDQICKQSSDGTTQRIRLQKEKFFNYKINLPTIDEQKRIFSKLKSLELIKESLFTELTLQLTLVKKLRQQLLQDAVQGKLVEQNEKDELASELLKKIKAEKQKLIAEKKLKKEKELPPIKPEEILFEVPENWVWCRLGEICTKIGSGSTPKGSNYTSDGKPFFRSQNIYDNGLVYDDIKFISFEVHKQMNGTTVYANDILLNITGGSMGRSSLVPEDFEEGNVSQHVCIIRPLLVDNNFYHSITLSPFFQRFIFSSTTGAGREGLPKYNLEQFIIPLPPLAEQHRIVQKLDELMQYCNELEASIKQSQAQNEKLLQQVLREALRGGGGG
ncbi:MAG: restriction endonuclease subunit S [Bacteroidota bacterium]|nr:restriction endonuclease subunit S [Bacteroidota bacterium]